MAARQIIVPGAMPSRDANGRALPARLRFYLPDTATPATVFADEALTVAHTWPLLSDSAGHFPAAWADDVQSFDVAYSDLANDALIDSYEDVAPAQGAVLASAALAQSAAASADASAAAAAASASAAATTLNETQDFVEDFGDIASAVSAAQTAATSATGSASAAAGSATAAAASAASAGNIGRHMLWIPAGGWTPRTTNGASPGLVELSSFKIMRRTLDFDASTIECAQAMLAMPKSWNEGAITAQFVWSHASTTTNFKVAWGIMGVALSDDDAADASFGTSQQANDLGGTTNDIYVSPETAAVTIAGSPIAEDLVCFQIFRNAIDATNDTLAVDALLIGVRLYFTLAAGNDA